MLCSPIVAAAASNATGVTGAGKAVPPSMTNGGLNSNKTLLSSNKSNPIGNSTSAINVNITTTTTTNNNSMRQQNYEMMMQSSESNIKGGTNTLIREIKSRNIGSLSPLCQSIAANLNQQQQQQFSANPLTAPPAYITGRRQAISMERLNNIHQRASPTSRYLSQIHSQHQHHARVTSGSQFIVCNKDNSGSLSSGSNSSIDESVSDAERQDPFHLDRRHQLQQARQHKLMARDANAADRSSALARSASRVSRFRSAKEFFERLSSVNGSGKQQQQIQNQRQDQHQAVAVRLIRQSPDRPFQARSTNVTCRYTNPLAASLTQVTPIGSTPGSPLKRNATNLSNHSSSPAINLLSVKNSEIGNQEPSVTPQVSQLKPQDLLARDSQPEAERVTSNETNSVGSEKSVRSPNLNTVGTVPRPRSLSLQLGAADTNTHPPTPGKQIQLPKTNSLAGAYVKLKTTDHSGLSTNTILHINNSQPANNSVILNARQPEPKPLNFCCDNVIVGTGSLLVRRNKQLRIHFDEQSAATFEYLSEEAFLEQFDAGLRPDSLATRLEPNWFDSNEDSSAEDDGEQEHQQDEPLRQQERNQESAPELGKRWTYELDRQPPDGEREHHTGRTLAPPKRPNLGSASLTNYRPSGLMSSDTSTNIDDNLGVRHLVKAGSQQVGDREENSGCKKGPNHWSTNNGSVIYGPSELVKSHLSIKKAEAAGESHQQNRNLTATDRLAPSNPNYQTLRATKHKMNNRLGAHNSETETSDNGLHSSPANWSNETETTSGLLF